ncbi:NH(3)-dependent NAD(+) synthetase [Paracoccus halophilus]|uniref:Glutamine-dependent NAD(+) synthetase n=1 Tax=Paracoccus halophilus TaxID=376733 RepID=A0A099F2H0_9RHOB|nr:NAD+ synthase [Paracoccus halophilus]KGJ04443.1 NAD synthetase [Paracoccus halophilus]SFA54238.1 NH(3)-dependent NAD(+) synthetase [Paracoccus halophilus]
MAEKFRITLAQLNPTVGDLPGNAAKARAAWERARDAGAAMLALPEMFITGYQTQDLVLKRAFTEDAMARIESLARDCADGPAIGIGGPWASSDKLYNAWWILHRGQVVTRVLKHDLPHKQLFDELRLFDQGPLQGPYSIGGIRIGSPICEDAWWPEVAETLAESGAEILIVPNGSPYHRNKLDLRMGHMVGRVVETGLPLVYLNSVGGQDDQLYDGASFVLNPGADGGADKVVQLAPFDEVIEHVDFTRSPEGWRATPGRMDHQPDEWEQDYRAMTEGLRDYMRKSGFKRVVLGLSGGIDSALVAAIAGDAIGPDNLRCVMLPSEYTSQPSLDDAADCATRLGARLDTVGIEGPRDAVTRALAHLMAGTKPDTTEENIQSRLRGVMLMAISNKFGELLLTTGNKSEIAVGYATIYGDMAGGYNPIKDLYKTRVFETCRWRNANHRDWMLGRRGEVIPPRIISKPPSAELRPDQKDQDSLPPYEVLDAILEGLVEKDLALKDLVAHGFDADTVRQVEKLLYNSEWKRYQAAPGPRISPRAFWLDRRYPLVNRWRDQL